MNKQNSTKKFDEQNSIKANEQLGGKHAGGSFAGHEFKKSLGQNFISDKNLLSAICADANLNSQDCCLEIGAGAGTLSDIIAKNCKKLVSLEVDKSLQVYLDEIQRQNKNLSVYYKDILKMELNELNQLFNEDNLKYKVVANLPYYITTPIIFKLLADYNRITSITIMVQKEVGDRMVAKSKTKNYGALSAVISLYGEAKIARVVSKNNFYPAPKVDSCIVNIIVNPKADLETIKKTENLIKIAFENRRKMLLGNIINKMQISKENLEQIFINLNINTKVRGEELNEEDFIKLSSAINNLIANA